MSGALLVGAAGAVVDLGHQLVDLHQPAERLAGAARQQLQDLEQGAVGARHEDVEARHFERVDDLVGDVRGLDRFDPALADAAGQLGVDDGRHHAGDLDPAAAQLGAHRLAEPDHGVLGRRVGGDPGDAALAGLGGDVDDVAAMPRGAHPLDRQLGAGDDAVEVDVDLAAHRVLALLDERRHRHDPGVVDDHVERAELALGLVEEGGEGGAVGDVERQRDGPAAERRRGLLGQRQVEVADRDRQPLRTSAVAVALPIPGRPR